MVVGYEAIRDAPGERVEVVRDAREIVIRLYEGCEKSEKASAWWAKRDEARWPSASPPRLSSARRSGGVTTGAGLSAR
jgi:hypothetical protein